MLRSSSYAIGIVLSPKNIKKKTTRYPGLNYFLVLQKKRRNYYTIQAQENRMNKVQREDSARGVRAVFIEVIFKLKR